jgi:hypothetical protein
MSRYSLHTVTSPLPVLVNLGDEEWVKDADGGRAHFLAGEHSHAFLRLVRSTDVKERLQKIFAPKEISLFLGAIQLRQALDARDEWALQNASQKVRPWLPDFAEIPTRVLEIDAKRKTASLKITGINHRYSGFLNYSRLIADMFAKARLVMWFSEKDGRFLPALYCPDWKTAACVVTFMGRIRVCPKCSSVFIPSDDKVEYCKPEHGVAYRTARSRWRAKQQVQKGKQHKKAKRTGRFVR